MSAFLNRNSAIGNRQSAIHGVAMNRMPTHVHGVVDYVVGAALTVLPRALGWSGAPARLLEGAGVGAIAYSMMTNYELGVVRALPMKAHLALDALSGGMLIGAAAMLSDEDDDVRAILAGIGLFEIAAALTTQTTSSTECSVEPASVSQISDPVLA
jgi:hypothetical protein